MGKLSSVTVGYDRKIQPAPYESAGASVSFTLVFDPEQEQENPAAEIAAALGDAQEHVYAILNIKGARPAVKRSAPKVETTEALPELEEPAEEKPKRQTAKRQQAKAADADDPFAGLEEADKKADTKPAQADADDPFAGLETAEKPKAAAPAEADKKAVTKQDINAGITRAMERLAKAGVPDGAAQIKKIVEQYLPDGKPPYIFSRIPEDKWATFLGEVNDLGRA